MVKKMSRDEFMLGLRELIKDVNNPHGEFAGMVQEGQEMIQAATEFDPEFGRKIENIIFAFNDLVSYAKTMEDIDGKKLK